VPLFEVEIDVTSAIAWYEVEAATEDEAMRKWKQGKFLSIENIDGEPDEAVQDFDEDFYEDFDPHEFDFDEDEPEPNEFDEFEPGWRE
jgi:hypothetical protein